MKKTAAFPWILLSLLVLSEILGWTFDKLAVQHTTESGFDFYIGLISRPWLWYRILVAPIQLFIWNKILTSVDLSRAYPATSLTTPLTMIVMVVFFGESLNWQVWVGAALIALGVAIIGLDKGQKSIIPSGPHC